MSGFFIPDWFLWTFGSIAALITVLGGAMALFGAPHEQEQAKTVVGGFWGAVIVLVLVTLAMTFVVKPVLNFLWELIF